MPGPNYLSGQTDDQYRTSVYIGGDSTVSPTGSSPMYVWRNPGPKKYRFVSFYAISAGGGGGSGARQSSGTIGGGGGGGAGASLRAIFRTEDLPGELFILVPNGGLGGAGVTVDGPGNSGGVGNRLWVFVRPPQTTLSTQDALFVCGTAAAGGGGSGALVAGGGAGAAATSTPTLGTFTGLALSFLHAAGGVAGAGATNTATTVGITRYTSGGGGGAGGTVSVTRDGASVTTSGTLFSLKSPLSVGGVAGANGEAGLSAPHSDYGWIESGGSGGGSVTSGQGGNGGRGGIGCGGGGGGSGTTTSGAGGDGGPGYLRIDCW